MRRLMLGIAVAVTSLVPVPGMANDQQIADFIKGRLQAEQRQGNLRGFNVDMRVDQGTVWFKGHVSNSDQEMMILKTAQAAGHLGVVKVVDDIESKAAQAPVQSAFRSAGYQQPQYDSPGAPAYDQQPFAETQPTTYQTSSFQQPSYQQPRYQQPRYQQPRYQQSQASPFRQASSRDEIYGEFFGGEIVGDYGGGQIISGAPMPFASSGGESLGEPLSYGPGPGTGGGISESPNLPGYAWPGYAASPNYGAVAYPKQHSASAWPYIGPFYPYPQVPLGWRKVSLEWDDGFWHLDFHDK